MERLSLLLKINVQKYVTIPNGQAHACRLETPLTFHDLYYRTGQKTKSQSQMTVKAPFSSNVCQWPSKGFMLMMLLLSAAVLKHWQTQTCIPIPAFVFGRLF
jgi:hypothetical protein